MKITDWLLSASTNTSSPFSPSVDENKRMPPKEKKGASSSEEHKKSSSGSGSHRHSIGGGGGSSASAGGTMTTAHGTHSTKHKQDLSLPQTKVKIIMKSSPEIDQVGHDVLYLISKATELFIDHVTTTTYNQSHKVKNIEYKHLADMTHKQGNLEFLRDIIPQKMLARDALKEFAKQTAVANKELLWD